MVDPNPWQVMTGVWRNTILAFWRLPLLILGCFFLYALLSGYWLHDLPFHVLGGFTRQAGYELLHAIVFAPLVTAVMLSMVRPDFRQNEIWTAGVFSVGIVILVRDLFILVCAQFLRAWKPLLGMTLAQHHYMRLEFAALIYTMPNLVYLLAIFLLSIRLILLLPLLGLEGAAWKIALSDAWRIMNGHYGFALVVSLGAILPLAVVEHFLNGFYRSLSGSYVSPSQLTFQEWEALMVRSAELTLDNIMNGALAAGLYLAMQARLPAAPAQRKISTHGPTLED